MFEFDEAPSLPSFDIIADALMPLGALNSPAELHGFLCGHLSAGARFNEGEWMDAAWQMLEVVQAPDRDLDDLFADLYITTLRQLRDGNMSFELLLPSDESPMEKRVSALSQWCHGFLTGYGSADTSAVDAQAEEDDDLGIDVNEALEDFTSFVQMSDDIDEDAEQENEANYYEVMEYVRVATLNLFMDIGIRADSDAVAEVDEANEDDDDESFEQTYH